MEWSPSRVPWSHRARGEQGLHGVSMSVDSSGVHVAVGPAGSQDTHEPPEKLLFSSTCHGSEHPNTATWALPPAPRNSLEVLFSNRGKQ